LLAGLGLAYYPGEASGRMPPFDQDWVARIPGKVPAGIVELREMSIWGVHSQ
jgi:hypothetical protein